MPDLVIQGVIARDEAAEQALLSEALLLESQLPVTIVNVTAGTVRHMPMFLEYQAARRTWLDAELSWLARDATIDASSVFTAAAPYALAAAAWRVGGFTLTAVPWLDRHARRAGQAGDNAGTPRAGAVRGRAG